MKVIKPPSRNVGHSVSPSLHLNPRFQRPPPDNKADAKILLFANKTGHPTMLKYSRSDPEKKYSENEAGWLPPRNF